MMLGIFPGDSEIQKTDLAPVSLPPINKIMPPGKQLTAWIDMHRTEGRRLGFQRHDTAKAIRAASFAFQGPRPSSPLTAQALEGLLVISDQLSHLQGVRTD